jgi:DNA polymerase-3 subunit beta
VLEGIRVRFGTDTIEFLATDRSKVAYSIRPVTGGTAIESSVVFPAKALVSLGRLSGQTETYAIAWDSHGVTVRFETARFYSRLLDGVYPDVDRMVPDEYPVQAVLSRLALRGACDRVASLVDAAMPQVYLSIGNDRVSLRGEAGSSRAEESVAAQRVGEDLAISFNGRLLLEGIDHLEGDEIVLELRSPEDLMRMRPVDRRDQYVVILPMMQG